VTLPGERRPRPSRQNPALDGRGLLRSCRGGVGHVLGRLRPRKSHPDHRHAAPSHRGRQREISGGPVRTFTGSFFSLRTRAANILFGPGPWCPTTRRCLRPGLTPHWYDFERSIYAARLGEGALQHVSQDLERSYHRAAGRTPPRRFFFSTKIAGAQRDLPAVLRDGILRRHFPRGVQSEFSPGGHRLEPISSLPHQRGGPWFHVGGISPPRKRELLPSKGGGLPIRDLPLLDDKSGERRHDPLSWGEPRGEILGPMGRAKRYALRWTLVTDPSGPAGARRAGGGSDHGDAVNGRTGHCPLHRQTFWGHDRKGPPSLLTLPWKPFNGKKGASGFMSASPPGFWGWRKSAETTPDARVFATRIGQLVAPFPRKIGSS
jgi:hypothetical protein